MSGGCALGIDHGTKRTGFAVADALRVTVEPLETFRGPGDGPTLFDRVAELCSERQVDVFVVGQPLNMDGSAGARAAEVDRFCQGLAQRFPEVQVVRVDERLSTKEAETRLVEAGHTGEARKARRDAWSAAILLEDWIASGEPGY